MQSSNYETSTKSTPSFVPYFLLISIYVYLLVNKPYYSNNNWSDYLSEPQYCAPTLHLHTVPNQIDTIVCVVIRQTAGYKCVHKPL